MFGYALEENFDLAKEKRRSRLMWACGIGLTLLIVLRFVLHFSVAIFQGYLITSLAYGDRFYVSRRDHFREIWLWTGLLLTVPIHLVIVIGFVGLDRFAPEFFSKVFVYFPVVIVVFAVESIVFDRILDRLHPKVSNRNLTLLIFAAALLAEPSFAQQKVDSSPCIIEYENHNQTDYGPLIVQDVRGTITDPQQGAVPKVCVGIFTEKDHKLVATTESDAAGNFSLQSVSAGRYRLVVKADPLCPANVPLEVVKHQKKKVLRVHMKPRGLDSCSYGEAVQAGQSAKSAASTY